MEEKFKLLEKAYDEKLVTFTENCEKKLMEYIKRTTCNFDNKINNLKTVIGTLKLSVQNQIDELNKWANIRERQELAVKNGEEMLSDFENVTNLCNEIKDHYKEIVELKQAHEEDFFRSIGFKGVSRTTDGNENASLNKDNYNKIASPVATSHNVNQQVLVTHGKEILHEEESQISQEVNATEIEGEHNRAAMSMASTVDENIDTHAVDLLIFMDSNHRYLDFRKF